MQSRLSCKYHTCYESAQSSVTTLFYSHCLPVSCYCCNVEVISSQCLDSQYTMRVFLSLCYSLLSCQFSFTFLGLSLKFCSNFIIILCLVVLSQHRDQIVIQISHLFSNYVASLWSHLWFIVSVCHVHVTSVMLVISVLGQVSFLILCMYCTVFFLPV
jgi:hypothetical protein